MNEFKISTPAEFSFEQCLHFLQRSPRELLHRVDNRHVTKLIRIEEEEILFRLSENKNAISVKVLLGNFSPETKQKVTQYVTHWFDLDKDLKPFYQLAEKDRILKKLIKDFFGYRIVGQPDLYESLVWAILGQQINLQFAYTLKQRFVQEYGKKVLHEGCDYYAFPEPGVVMQLNDTDLLKLQFSRQKSKYTISVSEAFASGALTQQQMAALSLNDAKTELMKIKGIGNWTANYALMKTFRYPDAFPLEDAGLHNALKNHLKLDRKPTLEEVKKVFKKYKGWEAYATLYLWKSLGG